VRESRARGHLTHFPSDHLTRPVDHHRRG
jgi:hypothetical protein